jgi:hypothetical protein
MGGGTYSSVSRDTRHVARGTYTKTIEQNFVAQSINNAMNPFGIKFRESRDSEEHPNSVPIIVALDVTGSMGSVPQHLVTHGLPKMMNDILGSGISDPQILFMGIGDHECDMSPLQVGQFESSDELVDKWLLDTYLEGGGGGNYGESYMLAWYFAAYHTHHDAMDKRKKKGYLFTIGDEPVLKGVDGSVIKNLIGGEQHPLSYDSNALLEAARKLYHTYHLHISETGSGSRKEVQDEWKQRMGDNCRIIQTSDNVSVEIAQIISQSESSSSELGDSQSEVESSTTSPKEDEEGTSKPEEIL